MNIDLTPLHLYMKHFPSSTRLIFVGHYGGKVCAKPIFEMADTSLKKVVQCCCLWPYQVFLEKALYLLETQQWKSEGMREILFPEWEKSALFKANCRSSTDQLEVMTTFKLPIA